MHKILNAQLALFLTTVALASPAARAEEAAPVQKVVAIQQSEIDTLIKELADAQAKIKTLQQQMAALTDRTAAVEGKATALQTKSDNHETRLHAMETSNTVPGLQTQVTALQTRATNLESRATSTENAAAAVATWQTKTSKDLGWLWHAVSNPTYIQCKTCQ